jgi:NADP-dependent 3-hydroxy acid dehydrogenase YdfG
MVRPRVVLVTGGTAGIGRATAQLLLEQGYTVHTCARDESRLRRVAAELPGLYVHRADVTDNRDREALMAAVLGEHSRLDALVNNAGQGWVGLLRDMSYADLRRLVEINLVGVIDLTRRALPALTESRGSVVMLSSSAGWAPGPPLSAYAATKAGVDGFVTGLRREVTTQGIRVHSIHPGPVRTEFIARAEGAHPAEDDGEWRLAPGVGPDRVAAQVLACLNAAVSRTVSVPRVVGLARLTRVAPINRALDLMVSMAADPLNRIGRILARRTTR